MAGSDLVQSLTRGLLVMEQLAAAPDGLSVAQLAERLAISAPATHNLLRTLAARHYVERLTQPVRYRLGARLGELAASQRGRDLRQELEQAMLRLHADLPAVAWVYAELHDGDVVGQIHIGPDTNGLEHSRRAPMGAWVSASAIAHQAWMDPAQRQAFRARHPFAEFGAGYWRDEAAVDAFLDTARRLGYAAPGAPDGQCRVAVPIRQGGGRLLGSLGGFWPCAPAAHVATTATLAAALRRATAPLHPHGDPA